MFTLPLLFISSIRHHIAIHWFTYLPPTVLTLRTSLLVRDVWIEMLWWVTDLIRRRRSDYVCCCQKPNYEKASCMIGKNGLSCQIRWLDMLSAKTATVCRSFRSTGNICGFLGFLIWTMASVAWWASEGFDPRGETNVSMRMNQIIHATDTRGFPNVKK